jgi:nucleoid DNA-binding protein
MKFISKYNNFLNESLDNNDVVDKIVETMLEFIDEGEKISFYSASGNMNYSDYLEKNRNYQNFKPVLKTGNKIISKFNIVYVPKKGSYDGAVEIMDNMKSTIGRLGDDGWTLYDFITKSIRYDKHNYGETCKINYIEFIFAKPDVILDDEEFELPNEEELREAIENQGINIEDLTIGDSETVVEFSDYDDFGEMNSEAWYEERFEAICDLFGFGSFDLQYRRATVTFEY